MNRLIVAFESDETITRVREMLAAASITPRSTHRTGADVVRAVGFMGGGTVVCGVKLIDMTAAQLHADLGGTAQMLVIGKPLQLEMYATGNVFKLALPINRFDLGASVRMLLQLEEMDLRQKRGLTAHEDEAIGRAKALLQSMLGMTEAEAHRYLQKRSMNAGVRIAQTAAMIIDSHLKGG